MKSFICPQCGMENSPEMSFCLNCGQSLPQESGKTLALNTFEPAPTVLSQQPNVVFPPLDAPPPSYSPSEQPFVPATKKSGKGLLFGLFGCGGLLVVSLIVLAIGIPLLRSYFGESSTPPKTETDNSVVNSSNTSSNSTIAPSNNAASTKLLSEMQALKKVGSFNRMSVKVVEPKEFFPQADAAVQSVYSDGSQVVASTSGKFPSNETALNNFDVHIKNVTNDGAQIVSNETKNGVKSAVYKYKNYYFIEVCAEGSCSRNNSSDVKALQSFVAKYAAALIDSKSNSSTSNTAATTETKTISGGVVNDKAVNLVTPTYPAAAKAVRASGTVNVQVTIDTDGNVETAEALSGHPLLKQAAIDAARASKFKPTVLDGQTVKVKGTIVYNFEAQ